MSASATASAWLEVYAIAERWEASSTATGASFIDRFAQTLATLETLPRSYGRVPRAPRGREVRVARIGNTMYLAFYEVRGDHATIFTVRHAFRQRGWRSQLS